MTAPILCDARPGDAGTILRVVRLLADDESLAHEVQASEAVLHEQLFGPLPRGWTVQRLSGDALAALAAQGDR